MAHGTNGRLTGAESLGYGETTDQEGSRCTVAPWWPSTSSSRSRSRSRCSPPTTPTPARPQARAGTGGEPAAEQEGAGRGGSTEQAEQDATTQERLDALAAARKAGTFGADTTVAGTPAPGWAGEQVFNASTDDWEPAIAADPHSPWVYALVTRYGTGKACQGNCPTPYMVLERSRDGGATWSKGTPLCACKGSGQFDPMIEVVPDTGDVYAAYMNGYNVVFLRSSDHGRTWTGPIATWGKVSGATSPRWR